MFLNPWPLSEPLCSISLSILYWAISFNIKDYANTLDFCSFMQNYWHHSISHLCKCFLVASYLLNHCYSVNSSCTPLSQRRNAMYLSKRWTELTLQALVIYFWNNFLQISSYKSPIFPYHASLIRASNTSLWSLTPLLYLCPCRTSATEPSPITQDSTHRSCKPVSFKRLPVMDNMVHAVWNTSIFIAISLNFALCFHCPLLGFTYSV